MEIVSKIHIPVESFGFIEIEYSFVNGNEDEYRLKMIDDYNLMQGLFKRARTPKGSDPVELGETMVENNRTYKAVMNEKTKKHIYTNRTFFSKLMKGP